ncbi:DUF2357 domain-containing protein [Pseudoneobacillus sp. C159]
MELHPISKFSFLDKNGAIIKQPIEWEPTLVQINVDPIGWEDLLVTFQNQPLEPYLKKLAGKVAIIVDLPRLNTGIYQLQTGYRGETEDCTFTVFPRKISEPAYYQLIEDLNQNLPLDIVISLDRMSGFGAVRVAQKHQARTLAQELERFKRALEGTKDRLGLLEVVRLLQKNHHQVLSQRHEWTPRERVRRPHPAKLHYAFTRPRNLEGHKPIEVIDTKMVHTVDTYENRLVKLFVHQVETGLKAAITKLKVLRKDESVRLAQDLVASLQKVLRKATFLKNVTLPQHFIAKSTMVLLKVPAYRAALEGYLELQRTPIIEANIPAMDAPLENLPFLYQFWATLKVYMSLLRVGSELGYLVKQQKLVSQSRNHFGLQVFKNGEAALILENPHTHTRITFYPEKAYSRYSADIKSVSFQQIPDISIEVESASERKVIIFDPKYKLDSEEWNNEENEVAKGKPKKVDIDKMHAYRDSIRDRDGQLVVMYASILYPGKTIHYFDGLGAIKAYPGDDDFQGEVERVLWECLATKING